MQLATTTGDMERYSDVLSEVVEFFQGTGFRFLDLNLYRAASRNSPFMGDQWRQWINTAGEKAASLNMKFCQAHAPDGNMHSSGEPFDTFLAATMRAIEACAMLNITNIVTHARDIGGFPSRENRRDNLARNRAFFSRLFPAMEKYGVHVLIENTCDKFAPSIHENTRNFPSTAAELLEIVEYVNHPMIGACWDTGHANIQGVDQYKSISELGANLKAIHIADNYGDTDSHVAPLQGTTNMDAVMHGLLAAGYKGFFTFESCNILRDGAVWPNYRREWQYNGTKVERLMNVPCLVKKQSITLLHQLGKHILEEYGLYEE